MSRRRIIDVPKITRLRELGKNTRDTIAARYPDLRDGAAFFQSVVWSKFKREYRLTPEEITSFKEGWYESVRENP
jgi:hypothetical protein